MVKICIEPFQNDEMTPYFENFGFPLSDFQKYAIEAIVSGNHALVTAHTGSGKTLPAEFSIRHFVGQGKKVIYTSPIKALSNQKFYEFSKKFPDIQFGIFTGDIKVNPMADVLIMTTEILMNYLFRISSNKPEGDSHIELSTLDFMIDLEKELACVIFDEVHYINDADRGKVWEQTILMLPRHIQMVMLSATIDRPEKFAKWIENRTTKEDTPSANAGVQNNTPSANAGVQNNTPSAQVWLASTNHRVVPLTHYTYMTTTESIFKHVRDKVIQKEIRDATNKLTVIKTPAGDFKETAVHEVQKIKKILDTNQQFMKRKHVLNNLTEMIKEKEMLPAIAFVFSRKNVEICAKEITTNLLPFDSKIPYTVATECEKIIRKFSNYREYLELPEYQDLVKLLEKGIGIHHSGMIPVLREIVEIMISKKYIMLLFATESFAIGLDCPIKTTIFTSLTKFDGKGPRLLFPHEYTQMAGRAGRRGIDKVGHIIHCNNLYMTPSSTEYRELLCGKPQRLVSKFEVSYDVIMNIIRANQPCNKSQMIKFIEKSMMAEHINDSINAQILTVGHIKEKYEEKKNTFALNTRTPREACEKWILYEQTLEVAVNKKRKEAERAIHALADEYRLIKDDVKRFKDIKAIEKEILEEEGNLRYLYEYIENQVSHRLQILLNQGFIDLATTDAITLTLLGKMSQVAEIPCLIGGYMMQQWNKFSDFGPIELVCAFSCFTQIKVVDDLRKSHLTAFDEGDLLFKFSQWAYESYKYSDDYDAEDLTFDLVDVMRSWYLAQDEIDCKAVIQVVLGGEKGISIGDFTKAVLKISKIGKEFAAICENIGEFELFAKLAEIDEHILKYMITAQSLYV
jgi:superfamily II RNA helicase